MNLLYFSSPSNSSNSGIFARCRRSLAEPPNNNNSSSSNSNNHIYEDVDQFHSQPPMITPVSGVPNVKGNKGVIRPIAFRPAPNVGGGGGMLSGASTPTGHSHLPGSGCTTPANANNATSSTPMGFRPILTPNGHIGSASHHLPPSAPRSAQNSNSNTPISGKRWCCRCHYCRFNSFTFFRSLWAHKQSRRLRTSLPLRSSHQSLRGNHARRCARRTRSGPGR